MVVEIAVEMKNNGGIDISSLSFLWANALVADSKSRKPAPQSYLKFSNRQQQTG